MHSIDRQEAGRVEACAEGCKNVKALHLLFKIRLSGFILFLNYQDD